MDSLNKGNLSQYLFLLFALIITSNRQTAAKEKHKGKFPKVELQSRGNATDNSTQFRPLNFSNTKLDWEGGSFPYEDRPHEDNDNVFYDRAVVVAPIVGSIFIILLVVIGVYLLRQYEIVDMPRGKDVEALCEHCARTPAAGIRYKIQSYVMRIFDATNSKQEAYFVQMDPRSRTIGEHVEARETLV